MRQDAAVLREILDAQLEMVCRFTADGTILYTNRAYAQTLGQSAEALLGRSLWDFIVGEDQADVREKMATLHPGSIDVVIENRFDTLAGPRWIMWRNHALGFDDQGRWTMAQSTGIDITERRLLEERTGLLIDELNHRVKNMLMVVQAIAFQSFRGKNVPPEPVAKFNERLAALSAAHSALSRASWAGAPIGDLVREGTAICHGGSDDGGCVNLSGPEVMIPAPPTVPLVMVLHELATNAMKYGALSVPEGSVTIAWSVDEGRGHVMLEWRELGGPPVVAPKRNGFGSRMIADAVKRQMHGHAAIDYDPAGLVCRLSFPLEGTRA